MQFFQDIVTVNTGNGLQPVRGASVTVYLTGTTTKPTIYSDNGTTTAANPLTTDNNGKFSFYASDAVYDLAISGPNITAYTVTAAFGGSSSIVFVQSGTGAVAEDLQSMLRRGFILATSYMTDAQRADVASRGRTLDVRAAVANAVAQAVTQGKVLIFPPGDYLFSTSGGTYSVVVPVDDSNFQPATESHTYCILLQNVGNVMWLGYGATLVTTVTPGSEMILGDGVRNFTSDGIAYESTYAHDNTGAVTTTGFHALGFTSQTRDSYNINIINSYLKNIHIGVYCFGDQASSYRVRGVNITNMRHEGGHYTIALHNNGNNVKATGVHSSDTLRELFAYGVSSVDIDMTSDTGVAGFGSLIKAYDADTLDVNYRLKTTRAISGPNVSLQSQHAPGVQATPKRVLNVTVDIDNKGTSATPVDFAYYRDNTLTADSSNNLFNGILLKGIADEPPTVSSTQHGSAGARGTLNTDGLILLAGSLSGLYSQTGFSDSKQTYGTATSGLKINSSATGITFGTDTVDWWRDGRFVHAIYRVILTSKGASVGSVTLALPVASAEYNQNNAAVVNGTGNANMSGLSSPITGYVQNSGSLVVLQQQGATGVTALADTNLTDTSDMTIQIRYPI